MNLKSLSYVADASMKALPKRKGNDAFRNLHGVVLVASMKVPPKRKGNASLVHVVGWVSRPQ